MQITPSSQVAASVHDDGLVLLHTGEGRLFASNRAGARIWEALERGTPVDTIASGMSTSYGIAAERAARDVAMFLAQLERHGLLERRNSQ